MGDLASDWGRRVYGLAAIFLGMVGFAYDDYAAVWEPVPKSWPAHDILAYVSAGILVAGGLLINLPRTARAGALVLAGFYGLWVVALKLPPVIAAPIHFAPWQAMSEIVAITLGGVLAWTTLGAGGAGERRIASLARCAFGACCIIFGVAHFFFAKETAAFIPAWIPPSQPFWADVTGVCQIAAGLAFISGVQARLAAVLLTVMYVGFGLLVHIPLLLKDVHSHFGWAANAVNSTLVGAAWCLADSLAKGRRTG
jgi:uncharacterized membrane protein YphA (DoxX/SURF4 family)